MSLDIYLTDATGRVVYSANYTHNVTKMADAAGLYAPLWRPPTGTRALDLIAPLTFGVTSMALNQKYFETFDSPNGWGKWESFLPWCARLLQACRDYPSAYVEVSR